MRWRQIKRPFKEVDLQQRLVVDVRARRPGRRVLFPDGGNKTPRRFRGNLGGLGLGLGARVRHRASRYVKEGGALAKTVWP